MKTDIKNQMAAENPDAVLEYLEAKRWWIRLDNDSKIKFYNAFHAMQNHLGCCKTCCEYVYYGVGDLCANGKEIIARELA